MSSTTHCHISDLFLLDSITSSSNNFHLTSKAFIHAVSLDVFNDSILVNLSYFNSVCEQFANEVIVFCSGTLSITELSTGYSQLYIKDHQLIRFVTHSCFCSVISVTFISFSDDSRKDFYLEQMPPIFSLTLDFTTAVTYHLSSNNDKICMFDIDLSIYKKKQGSQVITENCHILCMFDNTSAC